MLADQNPLTPRGADAAQLASAWSNGSFVARARGAAARLLQTSHGGGFQYGGALAAFAGEFGMASFALAACGALADGLSLGAAALFEAGAVRGLLVELTRRRSGRALWLRFVELDLHDVGWGRLEGDVQLVAVDDRREGQRPRQLLKDSLRRTRHGERWGWSGVLRAAEGKQWRRRSDGRRRGNGRRAVDDARTCCASLLACASCSSAFPRRATGGLALGGLMLPLIASGEPAR